MKKIFATLLIAFSLTSCVSSLQPLVTLETIATDNRITGNWTSDGKAFNIVPLPQSEYVKELQGLTGNNKTPRPLNEEEKRDSMLLSKMYVVSYKDNGVSYNLGIKLIKLNGQLFADLYPLYINDGKQKDDPYGVNHDYLPGFTIAKIEMNNSAGMMIKFIDGEFILKQVKEGRIKLKYESNELFGTFLVTASTEELKQFVTKYGNDERIFSKNAAITLTRKLNL